MATVRESPAEHKTSAMSVFNELRLEGKLCDAVVKASGVEFRVHRVILCGCSSYFRALFTSDWCDTQMAVYSFPGVSPEVMRLIVEYAYTCAVPVTPDNVERLLAAADHFNVMGVVRECCRFLEGQLSPDNCIGVYKFASLYFCPELRQRAYLFILHHFEEVVRSSDEFLELEALQLCDIIEKDHLNIKRESVAFEAVLRWIAHAPSGRKRHISLLLSKVRLALMDTNYFMNNVKNNEMVKHSEECKPIIINTLKSIYHLTTNETRGSDFQNPLTRPRLPYSVLLAIGGWSGSSPTNGIEAYDGLTDHWLNVTVEEESPRAYHGAAYLDGFVYCIGGFDGEEYFSSVRKLNPVTRTWHQAAPMHSRRCYVSVAVLEGLLYAMGGFDGYVRLDSAEQYDPEANQWTVVSSMHERRSDASATTLRGKVYICGGFNGNECLSTAEHYNPESNQWTLIAPMRSPRSGVGVIAGATARGPKRDSFVGGFDRANRLQNAEAYNPLTDSWRAVPTMFNPRSNFGIEVMDDLLFVVGGFNGLYTTFNAEYYDQKTDKWYKAHNMGIFRSALSCCVVPGLPNVHEYVVPRDTLQSPRKKLKLSTSHCMLSM
uniref:Kelch like family member 10 n=1 Tax=Scleropages formosus TaxID=113540 RepID=A0A8C9TRR6_SCLFO